MKQKITSNGFKKRSQFAKSNEDLERIKQYFEVFDENEKQNIGTIIEKGKVKDKIKVGGENFIEWVTYTSNSANSETYPTKLFPKDLTQLPAYDEKGRIRYELFCGGYLFYH